MNNDNTKKIFSSNLVRIMEVNNKKQIDLINDLGISSSTVSNWCTGLKMPRMDKIQMLADYFNVLKSDLIEDKTSSASEKCEISTLTNKDEKDIANKLEDIKEILETQNGLLFSGDVLDDETRELLLASLERTIRQSKVLAKEKFTPNKYK